MNLQNLKWTKNIKPMDQESWAYQVFKPGSLFKLAWKDDEGNASKPQRGDLILLRQGGYVTHLVEVLDYKPEREKWQGDFNIYRIVEVLWVIDWNNLPNSTKADEVFGYPVKLQGGDVMFLETMPTFQQRWQNQGGLPAFQERVQAMLTLPESSDNGQGKYEVLGGVAMTELLECAIARLQALPESEQDAIAAMILEEIEDDRRWDESFSRSPNILAKLAASAMAEYHAGQTQELDPETL